MHPIACKCGAPCRQRRREAEAVLTDQIKDTIIREARFLLPLHPWANKLELERARKVKPFGYG